MVIARSDILHAQINTSEVLWISVININTVR